MNPDSTYRDWAQRFDPERAALFVHNQIKIDASPAVVWNLLLEAPRWPGWFRNAQFVRIRQPVNASRLALGTVFSWASYLFPLRSVVVRCDPPPIDGDRPAVLGWDFNGWKLAGHHVWLITTEKPGCLVVTEEVEVGLLPRLIGPVLRRMMWASHERWVMAVKRAAERPDTGGVPNVPSATKQAWG